MLRFVFVECLVERFGGFCSLPFCLLVSAIVRDFLPALLSDLMSMLWDESVLLLMRIERVLVECELAFQGGLAALGDKVKGILYVGLEAAKCWLRMSTTLILFHPGFGAHAGSSS